MENCLDLPHLKKPEVREFAIGAAAQHNIESAIPAIIKALNDSADLNKRSAVRALGDMRVTGARDTLMFFLRNNSPGHRQDVLLNALASLGSKEIILILEESLGNAEWYQWSATIRNIMKPDTARGLKHLYDGLEN